MKRKKVLFFCVIFSFFLIFCAFANQFENQLITDNVFSTKLNNGFEVVVLEDDSTPLVNVSFIVKAGFSSQTKQNAGIAQFVSELIFKESQCYNDYVLFTFETTQNQIKNLLNDLSVRLQKTEISDETLQSSFNSFVEIQTENLDSPTFLLNSAINSKIFSTNPWQTDSGMSKNFLQIDFETLKQTWHSFFTNFYTPQNSTIFFSGNITNNQALHLAEQYFGSWADTETLVSLNNNQQKANDLQKKYVIVSDDFSADFNQFIIQFANKTETDLQTTAKFELASKCLENSIDFKQMLIDSKIGLHDFDYFYSGISTKGKSTRVILQSLLDSNIDPVLQCNTILDSIDFCSSLDFDNDLLKLILLQSQNQIIQNMQNLQSSSKELLSALTETWYYAGKDFFVNYQNALQNISFEQVKDVFNAEPYIFIAMNESVFCNYQASLQEAGFSVITNENAFWFDNFATKTATEQVDFDINTEIYDNDDFAELFATNLDSFATTTLPSGVPVFTKKTNFGNKISLRFCILGGESLHESPALETVIINALTENIAKSIYELSPELAQNCTITHETELYKSNITLTFNAAELSAILKAVNEALFFGEISSAFADELIFAENYNWRLQKATEQNQLKMAMYQALFSGTTLEKFFTQGDSLLVSARFTDILSAYTKLLDSSRFVIFACGSIPENFTDLIAENFSELRRITNPTNYNAKNCVIPNFLDKKLFVKLERRFKNSGVANGVNVHSIPMPLKLIPTTKFEDPAIFCFEAPDFCSENYALFCATMCFFEQSLKEKYPNELSITITNKSNPLVVVEFLKVPENFDIDSFFTNELLNLRSNILNNPQNQDKIKHLYTIKEFSGDNLLENATKNMENGFYFGDNSFSVTKYLTDYRIIQNATLEDFAKSVEFLFATPKILKVFSK